MNMLCRCGSRLRGQKISVHDAARARTIRSSGSDPTWTLPLQRRFQKDLRARWDRLRKLIPAAVDQVLSPVARAGSDPIRAFQSWFDAALQSVVLGQHTGAWALVYVRQAGDCARLRSQLLLERSDLGATADRIPQLQTLAIAELQGICEATSQQAVRALGNGLLTRQTPAAIARSVQAVVDSVGKQRSDLLVSFFVVRAFSAVTLDCFRAAGLLTVGVVAERVGLRLSPPSQRRLTRDANEDEPRDARGRWTSGAPQIKGMRADIDAGDAEKFNQRTSMDDKGMITVSGPPVYPALRVVSRKTGEVAGVLVGRQGDAHADIATSHGIDSELVDGGIRHKHGDVEYERGFVQKDPLSGLKSSTPSSRKTRYYKADDVNLDTATLAPRSKYSAIDAKPKNLVEVLTAGDDDVCPVCEEISESGPYTLDEAEELIPAHPRCRCALVPWGDARFASVHDYDPDEARDRDGKWTSFSQSRGEASGQLYDLFGKAIGKNNLSDEEKTALSKYTGDGFESINRGLRSGRTSATTDAIDAAMKKFTLPSNIVVHRGVGDTLGDKLAKMMKLDHHKTLRETKNAEFTDRAFVSTSATRSTAKTFSRNTVEIRVPKGTHVIPLPNGGEEEILLPRGSRFRIVEAKKLVTGYKFVAEYVDSSTSASDSAIVTDEDAGVDRYTWEDGDVELGVADVHDYDPDEPRNKDGEWSSGDEGGFDPTIRTPSSNEVEKFTPDAKDFPKGKWQPALEAQHAWIDSDYEFINAHLRFGTNKDMKDNVQGLDDAFKYGSKSLPEKMLFYRSTSGQKFEVGQTFVDKGFVSITHDESFAKNFNSESQDNFIMHVTVPKGVKVISPKRGEDFDDEPEILLNRGTKFKIDDVDGRNVYVRVLQ